MIQLVYSPQWFYGIDIVIDLLSLLVLILIASFSLKYYRTVKNKNYLYFGTAFLILAFSFLFKILTNFTIYHTEMETAKVGYAVLKWTELEATDTLFFIGSILNRILTITGLYLLYALYSKQKKLDIILTIYLLLMIIYFSQSAYYIFHFTALLFLVLITKNYFIRFKDRHHINNKWLFHSFAIITLSQVVFIFVGIHSLFYVAAEIIQLLGFMLLLTTFIKVLMDGKKTRKK